MWEGVGMLAGVRGWNVDGAMECGSSRSLFVFAQGEELEAEMDKETKGKAKLRRTSYGKSHVFCTTWLQSKC
jgi:hypothetical protein